MHVFVGDAGNEPTISSSRALLLRRDRTLPSLYPVLKPDLFSPIFIARIWQQICICVAAELQTGAATAKHLQSDVTVTGAGKASFRTAEQMPESGRSFRFVYVSFHVCVNPDRLGCTKTSTALSSSSWGKMQRWVGSFSFVSYRKSKKSNMTGSCFPGINEDDDFGVCDAATTFPLPLCWNEQHCQIM